MSQDIEHCIEEMIAAWNDHNPDRIAACYAADYVGRDVGEANNQEGRPGVRNSVIRYLTAFPDIHFQAEDIVIQGDRVALTWTAQGTHSGPLMNIPPTGHKVAVRGMSMLTVNDGTIKNGLYIWDVAGLLRAINLLPEL